MRVRLLAMSLLAALAVVSSPGTDAAAQSLDDIRQRLDEVASQREATESRIARATEEIEALETKIAELDADRQDLEERVGRLRTELDELSDLVVMRVRQSYMHGSTIDPMAVFLGSDDPDAALSRAETISRVISGDEAKNQELTAARQRLGAAEQRLAEQAEALATARQQQAQVVASLRDDFAEIRDLEAQLTREEREEEQRLERLRLERERQERERRERERRQTAERRAAARDTPRSSDSSGSPGPGTSDRSSPAPTGSGGMACPLDRPRHFIDSWGYARSGGRSHQGTDIMGPRGIPVRAITDGTWQIQSPGASAGLWAILRGSNGDHYWYLHLDSHTVASGTRVNAGQQVGTNGSTGNATAGAEHVHFELHPGGGSAVNPYSLLRRVCG